MLAFWYLWIFLQVHTSHRRKKILFNFFPFFSRKLKVKIHWLNIKSQDYDIHLHTLPLCNNTSDARSGLRVMNINYFRKFKSFQREIGVETFSFKALCRFSVRIKIIFIPRSISTWNELGQPYTKWPVLNGSYRGFDMHPSPPLNLSCLWFISEIKTILNLY